MRGMRDTGAGGSSIGSDRDVGLRERVPVGSCVGGTPWSMPKQKQHARGARVPVSRSSASRPVPRPCVDLQCAGRPGPRRVRGPSMGPSRVSALACSVGERERARAASRVARAAPRRTGHRARFRFSARSGRVAARLAVARVSPTVRKFRVEFWARPSPSFSRRRASQRPNRRCHARVLDA